MDVFVIPVGPGRYELYCEQPFTAEPAAASATAETVIGRIKRRFEDLLRRAEQWEPPSGSSARGFMTRVHDTVMGWVAERVVEQRLLWNLRRESTVTAVHPDDLSSDEARAIVYRALEQDANRHGYWVWVDGLLFVVTFVALGPLFLLIPGVANLPALYFGFRTVGHWYSRGGARHGLRAITWTGCPSSLLTELRELPTQSRDAQDLRVEGIAARLHLRSLGAFYDRVSKASL
jgi:hypothetical protein